MSGVFVDAYAEDTISTIDVQVLNSSNEEWTDCNTSLDFNFDGDGWKVMSTTCDNIEG